jgi:hypothetical protein
MESSHRFPVTELPAGIKMVPEVKSLPPVCRPAEPERTPLQHYPKMFIQFLIGNPSCLVLFYLLNLESIRGLGIFFEVLQSFSMLIF